MKSNKTRFYFSALLAAFLFIAPNLSWATFNLIKDARDPVYKNGLQSFKSKDYRAAYHIWLPLANNGNSKAQYYIGYMYLHGLYVAQDSVEARKWFERAAGQGDANAQNDLGTLYLNGQGIQKNLDMALKWFEASANQGNATAQYNLGIIYTIKKKFGDAKIWFEASALQGYAKANYRLKQLFSLNAPKLPQLPQLPKLQLPKLPKLSSLKPINLICSNDPNTRSLLPPPLCNNK